MKIACSPGEGRYISEQIKREVRRRDGFGCIFCGKMLVEYHHIIPYSENPLHSIDNIVLLCRDHHADVTTNRKSSADVIRARDRSYSSINGTFSKYRFEPGQNLDVVISGSLFRFLPNHMGANIILINDEVIFSITICNEIPLFTFKVHDWNNDTVIDVQENYVTVLKKPWDIKISGNYLRGNFENRVEFLKIKIFESKIYFEKLFLYYKGYLIYFINNSIYLGLSDNNIMFGSGMFRGYPDKMTSGFGINCSDNLTFALHMTPDPIEIGRNQYISEIKRRRPKNIIDMDGFGPYGFYKTTGK